MTARFQYVTIVLMFLMFGHNSLHAQSVSGEVTRSAREALRRLEARSNAGDEWAKCFVAWIYYNGGALSNSSFAANGLPEAARKYWDDFLLARRDHSLIKNKPRALELYRECAAAAVPRCWAMYALYSDISPAETLGLLQRAADAGDANAMHWLALMTFQGNRVLGIPSNRDAGIRLYRKAAEAGFSTSMFNLGAIYSGRDGFPKDEAEAMRWYQKAAQSGDSAAMMEVALRLEQGLGAARDPAGALAWLRRAGEGDDPQAKTVLGWLYEEGRLVPRDEQRAARLYWEAANAGHARGMNSLGWMYYTGRGVEKNEQEAARWLSEAAKLEDSSAKNNLAILYLQQAGAQKREQAERLLRDAADQGNPRAMANLAALLLLGRRSTSTSEEGVRWLKKAAELGDAVAQTQYGVAYLEQSPPEYATAAQWLEKAADQGDATAQLQLGALYEIGRGVPKNLEQAKSLYARAANGPDADIAKRARDREARLREAGPSAGTMLAGAAVVVGLFTLIDNMLGSESAGSSVARSPVRDHAAELKRDMDEYWEQMCTIRGGTYMFGHCATK